MSRRTAILRAGRVSLIATVLSALPPSSRAEPDGGAGALDGGAPSSNATEPPSADVTIAITVHPPRKASVFWGKKQLGVIKPRGSLSVHRRRDSGPLDLMIRADDCLPVQTRAHTFNDHALAVRLTPLDQKATLLGYREELLPDGGTFDVYLGADAGLP